ncbi:Highly reducing polyketide synthase sdnO [Bienertia sinuspersici]
MAWSSLLYDEVLRGAGDFKLRENELQKITLLIYLELATSFTIVGILPNLVQSKGTGLKSIQEDYVFGNLKFGGNAQSITKNRWIHHTSFLWDYEDANMTYLRIPQRAPKYRQSTEQRLSYI